MHKLETATPEKKFMELAHLDVHFKLFLLLLFSGK